MKKITNSNIKKFNNTVCISDDDDEDNDIGRSPTLGYFRKTRVSSLIEIPIDEEIKGPSYYRNVAQAIRDSDEGDLIRFLICSPGGRLDGLMSLLSSIWKTDATTEAHIEGFADSAASMLSMYCDNVYVSPMASMLVHSTSYGTGFQKAADIHQQVQHFNNYSEIFFRDTYQFFLTDEEIQKCLDGYQLYLNADQIAERLERKFSILKELSEDEDCNGDCEGCNSSCKSGYCTEALTEDSEVHEVEPEQPKPTKTGRKTNK